MFCMVRLFTNYITDYAVAECLIIKFVHCPNT